MDSLQDLSEFRTTKLNSLWTVATNLESDMLQQILFGTMMAPWWLTRPQRSFCAMSWASPSRNWENYGGRLIRSDERLKVSNSSSNE
ncbi:hypothetical protein LB505_006516 [Fusarium chuoi]|nr:hypothetical protein LB505_006516 [Fusarium chuoi]